MKAFRGPVNAAVVDSLTVALSSRIEKGPIRQLWQTLAGRYDKLMSASRLTSPPSSDGHLARKPTSETVLRKPQRHLIEACMFGRGEVASLQNWLDPAFARGKSFMEQDSELQSRLLGIAGWAVLLPGIAGEGCLRATVCVRQSVKGVITLQRLVKTPILQIYKRQLREAQRNPGGLTQSGVKGLTKFWWINTKMR